MARLKGINWDIQPLGQMSDDKLAQRLSVHVRRVKSARERRKIPAVGERKPTEPRWIGGPRLKKSKPSKSVRKRAPPKLGRPPKSQSIDWDAVDLGKRSDNTIAQELGVSRNAVLKQRNNRGIPPYTGPRKVKGGRPKKQYPIDWDSVDLGQRSDYIIAKELGVSSAAVRSQRSNRGIPRAANPTGRGIHRTDIDWDDQPLGEVSDAELARELGVSAPTVARHRRKRNIKPATIIQWDQEPLGQVPDKMLALMLNCHISTVIAARNQRDIPPFVPKRSRWIND